MAADAQVTGQHRTLWSDSDSTRGAALLPYQIRPRRRTRPCGPAHSMAISSSKFPVCPVSTQETASGCGQHEVDACKPIRHQFRNSQTVTCEQSCSARDVSLDAPPKDQRRPSASSSSAAPSRAAPLPPPPCAIAAPGANPSYIQKVDFFSPPTRLYRVSISLRVCSCRRAGKCATHQELPHHPQRPVINAIIDNPPTASSCTRHATQVDSPIRHSGYL